MVNRVRLSSQQQAVVNAPWKGSTVLVLSTAGSGKTLVLTKRAVRIAEGLLDEHVRNKRILCVCFNQAMADEMYHRISQLVYEQNLSGDVAVTRSSLTVSRAVTIEVRTFHGLGRFILNATTQIERDAVALPTGYLNVLQGKSLAKLFYEELKLSGILQPHDTEKSSKRRLYDILSSISDFKSKCFDKACERNLLEGVQLEENETESTNITAFQIYEALLFQRSVIDYGDMIWKSVRLLLKCRGIREFLKHRYSSVLVDEFQDVSASQLIMCKAAIEESNSLTLVGDDDQQIYSWRTSNNWFCHKVAKHIFPNMNTLVLTENRRCPGSVVRAAYAVISRNPDRAPKEIRAVRSDGFSVHVVGCKNLQLEIQFVINSVQRLLKKTQRTGERILVLFRVNELLLTFQEEFKKAGILTTRCIRPKANVAVIGAITLATLALVTLISPDVDIDTFVWAVMTLSPNLNEKVVHEILAKGEKAENMRRLSNSLKRTRRSLGVGNPSAYLERLKLHFTSVTNEDRERSIHGCEPLYWVVKKCDELLFGLKQSHQVEDLLRKATCILKVSKDMGSQESADEPDMYNLEPREQRGDFGGYDILIRAAKRVDEKSKQRERRERELGPPRRVQVQTVEEAAINEGNSDLEDFAQLFSSDVSKSRNKQRKAQGIRENETNVRLTERLTTNLFDDVNEFCNRVRRSLGDYSTKQLNDSTQAGMDSGSCPVLSTVHNAKGSTFHHVFLCGVSKYNFPNGQIVSGIGNFGIVTDTVQDFDSIGSHCQEERRVFFVAQTRAMTQFICTYSGEAQTQRTPKEFESMFIKEMISGVSGNGMQDVVELFITSEQSVAEAVDKIECTGD